MRLEFLITRPHSSPGALYVNVAVGALAEGTGDACQSVTGAWRLHLGCEELNPDRTTLPVVQL